MLFGYSASIIYFLDFLVRFLEVFYLIFTGLCCRKYSLIFSGIVAGDSGNFTSSIFSIELTLFSYIFTLFRLLSGETECFFFDPFCLECVKRNYCILFGRLR